MSTNEYGAANILVCQYSWYVEKGQNAWEIDMSVFYHMKKGAPIGAKKSYFPPCSKIIRNRPTNQPTEQPTDQPMDRPGHREVSLPIIGRHILNIHIQFNTPR